MIPFTGKDDTITFAVRVQPNARQSMIVGAVEGALKIKIAAPPVDGAANDELIRLLAKFFTVPRRQVTLLAGTTARKKVVQLQGKSAAEFIAQLAPQLESNSAA